MSGIAEAKSARSRPLERAQWRQLILITVAAVGIYAGLRVLPTGTNLNHMDFRVQGKNSIEFCDPLNPQFIPVVAARSPVSLRVATERAPVTGSEIRGVLTLKTSSGKGIAPEDLLVVHTRPLHLMIVDPTLSDYQHVHPEPGAAAGDWTFSFTPRKAGTYRLFADFTPVATARGLYASADVEVATRTNGAPVGGTGEPANSGTAPYRFSLTATKQPLRVKEPIDFTFSIAAKGGAPVPLAPVMGAYAHLVAFDESRSGFAHLHPAQVDPLAAPDATHPTMSFKLTIPNPGNYVIWTQVNLAGQERFVPFRITVVE